MTYNQQYEPTSNGRNAGKESLIAAPLIGVLCAAQAAYPSTREDKSTADSAGWLRSNHVAADGYAFSVRRPTSKLRVHLSVS